MYFLIKTEVINLDDELIVSFGDFEIKKIIKVGESYESFIGEKSIRQ